MKKEEMTTMTREELITWARTNPNVAALYGYAHGGSDTYRVVVDEYKETDVRGVGIAGFAPTEASPRMGCHVGGVEYYEKVAPRTYNMHFECLYKRGDAEPKKPWARVKDLVTPHTKSKAQVSKALNAGMKEHRTRLERMVAGEIEDVYAMHTEWVQRRRGDTQRATREAKGVGISARKELAPLVYDQGEDEFGCDADTERKVRRGK